MKIAPRLQPSFAFSESETSLFTAGISASVWFSERRAKVGALHERRFSSGNKYKIIPRLHPESAHAEGFPDNPARTAPFHRVSHLFAGSDPHPERTGAVTHHISDQSWGHIRLSPGVHTPEIPVFFYRKKQIHRFPRVSACTKKGHSTVALLLCAPVLSLRRSRRPASRPALFSDYAGYTSILWCN